MRKTSVLLIALLVCLPLLAADSPKLELSWKNPKFAGGTFKNILVLGLNGKAENRMEFEDQLVAAISRPGGKVEPSYAVMARDASRPIDMNDLRALVKEQKIDAIVVARLIKRSDKTTYVPGEIYTPMPYYRSFYGYYGALYPVVYSPGYMETEKVAQVEVNVYSTAQLEGELVWTGITNEFEIKSELGAIKQLVKIMAAEIEKQKIIEQESR